MPADPLPRRAAHRAAATPWSPCPGRRASPTGRWCAPRWPTAPARSAASACRRRHRGDARLPSRRLGADVARRTGARRRRWSWGRPVRCGPVRSSSTPACPARRPGSCSALAALGTGRYRVDGGEPAPRPARWAPVLDALRALGARHRAGVGRGHLPVRGDGRRSPGRRGGRCRGDVSSQFLSGLLLVAPGHAQRGSQIELTTPLVSRPYVGHDRGRDGRVRRRRRGGRASDRSTVGPGRYRRRRLPDRARRVGRVVLLRRGRHHGRPGHGRRARADAAAGRRWPSSTCSGRWAPRSSGAPARSPSTGTGRCAASTSTWPTVRHRADPGRRGRLRRRRPPGSPASGSSGGKETDRIAAWSPSCGGCGIDADGGARRLHDPPRPRRRPAHASRPTTTTAWRWLRPARPAGRRASRSPTPACVAKTFPGYWSTARRAAAPRLTARARRVPAR